MGGLMNIYGVSAAVSRFSQLGGEYPFARIWTPGVKIQILAVAPLNHEKYQINTYIKLFCTKKSPFSPILQQIRFLSVSEYCTKPNNKQILAGKKFCLID